MLPKFKRLNLKKDFKWVAFGKKVESKYLKLFIRLGENQTPKVGIASFTKSFKKATQRSRVRRIVSSAFEALYNHLPKKVNIIALPKQGVLGVKSADVRLDLEEALISSNVIGGNDKVTA